MSEVVHQPVLPSRTQPSPLRWLAGAVFGVLVAAAFVVTVTAALFLGALAAGAALLMRLAPRRRPRSPALLEGRRTPDGWEVEAAAPR